MSRQEHENIVGLVCSIVSCFHMEMERHKLANTHGSVVRELAFADVLFGIKELGLRADVYIQPPFVGTPPIFIEVGKMRVGKWDGVVTTAGNLLTIVHIELDGSIHVIHPRNTRYENDLVLLLRDLWPLREAFTTGNQDAGKVLHDRVIQVVENISRHVALNKPQQAGLTVWEVDQMQDTFGQIKTWLLEQGCTPQVNRAIKVIEKELDQLGELAWVWGDTNSDTGQ